MFKKRGRLKPSFSPQNFHGFTIASTSASMNSVALRLAKHLRASSSSSGSLSLLISISLLVYFSYYSRIISSFAFFLYISFKHYRSGTLFPDLGRCCLLCWVSCEYSQLLTIGVVLTSFLNGVLMEHYN